MINYTVLVLFLSGMLGILLHNLVKIDALNRASNGNFKLGPYLKLEWVSILISILAVIAFIIGRNSIKQLEDVGKLLGFGFIAIGYMAQSLFINWMGKAQKMVDKINKSE